MAGVDYRQGDYRVVAERLRPAAERLVTWCGDDLGDLVVDVAAGSGNVAHACATRGARVVAVDKVPEQLALGRTTGTSIDWVAGDAHALPLRDAVATAALSTFGLIYASDPDRAVAEMARVCGPGRLLGLTAWPVGGFQDDTSKILADLAGIRAQGHDHIGAWGTADAIRTRLQAASTDVEVQVDELWSTHESVEQWWAQRVAAAPPIVSAKQRLDDVAFAELGRQMMAIAERYASDTPDGIVLRDTYLLARARVR